VRAFLAGYLPYLYGQTMHPALAGATADLRVRLLAHPPHTTRTIRSRRPRVTELRTLRVKGGLARLLATVADGDVRYPIVLALARRSDGRWEVSSVAGE
jgi:hypothetical protein